MYPLPTRNVIIMCYKYTLIKNKNLKKLSKAFGTFRDKLKFRISKKADFRESKILERSADKSVQ